MAFIRMEYLNGHLMRKCINRIVERSYNQWSLPFRKEMYKRRIEEGPDSKLLNYRKSDFSTWNYDVELDCFSKRLKLNLDLPQMREIFDHKSNEFQKQKFEKHIENGFEFLKSELSQKLERCDDLNML